MKQESYSGVSFETNLQSDHAARYAAQLLQNTPDIETAKFPQSDHPATAWRRSGLLGATKRMLPLPLVSHVDGALMALQSLWPDADLPQNGAVLMGERARLRETVREGRANAGGYGRLLDTRDGRIALNLVRDEDWDLIPAWLEDYITDWDGITQAVASKYTEFLMGRGAELGLAVSRDAVPEKSRNWVGIKRFEPAPIPKAPLIVDLSGLWAGPLASSLLQMCGARVIKVEGPGRPDGMRRGHAGFYELINGGKDCAAFDFKTPNDLANLKILLTKADIVIEASRPRAFRQLGIIAEDYMRQNPGKIWARLTAYGQHSNRIGFGDDIGISAGLSTVMERAYGEPCFVGDAIADSVCGVHLALAIGLSWQSGGGALLDMAMAETLRYAMGDIPDDLPHIAEQWSCMAEQDSADLYPMRQPLTPSKPLGADTENIVAALC